ncbi:hypothetical protein QYM36_009135 [Artemia franciscana]|uniref:USP domain-containing protein n=1 Tax=Artemia franciscana TaxID=6661 RepID=A0AA88I2M6_ARTSF|nr:hypothetical protein QYM36_009135 [Artemia franciscana]
MVVGLVSHIGATANSGHYVYIRRCTMHKWILYDDQILKPITIDPEKYSQNACLLLLKKKSSTIHINPENIWKQLNRLSETVREKERQEDRAEKEKTRQETEIRQKKRRADRAEKEKKRQDVEFHQKEKETDRIEKERKRKEKKKKQT